jgi:hypothetical protein
MNTEPDSSVTTRRGLLTSAAALMGSGAMLHQALAQDPHAGHKRHGTTDAAQKSTSPAGGKAVSTGKTEIFAPEGISYKPVITPKWHDIAMEDGGRCQGLSFGRRTSVP